MSIKELFKFQWTLVTMWLESVRMKFNEKHLDGYARNFDTLGMSALVGAIVGASGHTPMSGLEITLLFFGSICCVVAATLLRDKK